MSNISKGGKGGAFGRKGTTATKGKGYTSGDDNDNEPSDKRETDKPVPRKGPKQTKPTSKDNRPDQNTGRADSEPDNDDEEEDGNKSKPGGVKKSGAKNRKGTGPGDGSDKEDGPDNEDDDDNEELNETEKTILDIEEVYKLADTRPPRLRFKKLVQKSVTDDGLDDGGDEEGEPDEEFIKEVQAAMDQVDEDIENQINDIKVIKGPDADKRRNAIFLNSKELVDMFGEATKQVMNDGQVKAVLAKTGMKVGGVAVRVLSVIGGVALFGVGAFLTVAALGKDKGAAIKVGAAIAKQVIKGGQKVGDKIDDKLDQDKLKSDNAQQLMRLLGTNPMDVVENGTINAQTLAAFSQFKLMAATEKAAEKAANKE